MQTTPGTPLTSAPTAATPNRRPRRLLLWASVATAAYVADQGTKWWAERALSDGEPRPLIGDLLQLHLTHNPGAAFGTGTGYTVFLTLIAMAVVVACLTLAGRLRSKGWAIALGLLLGGALGNVTDRIFRDPAPLRGHVVDFLELPHWPIFNIADTVICTAAVLFVLLTGRGIHLDGTTDADRAAERAAVPPGPR